MGALKNRSTAQRAPVVRRTPEERHRDAARGRDLRPLTDTDRADAATAWAGIVGLENALTGVAGVSDAYRGIATPLSTTLDESFAGSVYGATLCSVESLESFAIAQACRAAEVPFAAALGVSHSVGPSAVKHWQQGQREAVTAAAHVVVAWLQQGAQGLPHGGV